MTVDKFSFILATVANGSSKELTEFFLTSKAERTAIGTLTSKSKNAKLRNM